MDFFPIDTTFYVVPKEFCKSLYFLYYALSEQDFPSMAADSAVPGLNRNLAYMNKQVLPPFDILTNFDKIIVPLYECIKKNNEESLTLASIRDVLLPNLISGELRIPGIERFAEETGL